MIKRLFCAKDIQNDAIKCKRYVDMRKRGWISPLHRIVLITAIIALLPVNAISNITQWDGAATGIPGPVFQSKLELQREYVLFKEGWVHATFWVVNPTPQKITIAMGFPVSFYGSENDDYATQFLESFDVKIGSEIIKPIHKKGQNKNYPYVYTWPMTFSPHSTLEFTVNYLMYPQHTGRPGAEDTRKFKYITHTGSNWAAPITKADFEFCDEDFIAFMKTKPGEYWAERGTRTYNIDWLVLPTPYTVNEKSNCIEWHRTHWKPVKDSDDIIVNYSFISGTDYRSGGVEPCWDGDCEK